MFASWDVEINYVAMLTRGIPGIVGLWIMSDWGETGGGQAVTPGPKLRLICTETLVKCDVDSAPTREISLASYVL